MSIDVTTSAPELASKAHPHPYGGLNSVRYHEPTLGSVEDVLGQLVTARIELAEAQRTRFCCVCAAAVVFVLLLLCLCCCCCVCAAAVVFVLLLLCLCCCS